MPNGLPTDEAREWSTWRGQITGHLEAMQRWTEKHEREEFQHHERIEQHMINTAGWIKESSQHRQDLSAKVTALENDVKALYRDFEAMKAKINTLIGVGLPIAAWALYQIVDHFVHRVPT